MGWIFHEARTPKPDLRCALTVLLFLAGGGAPIPGASARTPVHHDLHVKIEPAAHRITGTDRVTVPAGFLEGDRIRFLMHGGLEVHGKAGDFRLEKEKGDASAEASRIAVAMNGVPEGVPVERYALVPSARPGDGYTFTVAFEGVIHHPVRNAAEEYARSFSQTPGIVSEKGTVLSSSSFWYPRFGEDLVTFRLEVELPAGHRCMTQGRRVSAEERDTGKGTVRREVWDCPHPMDEIYLIEGNFTEYADTSGKTAAYAFLRTPDPALAAKYLDATGRYIEMYEKLIGPYPYGKFALVENFWETGYGMPSFTLLGPKVIRFPFILRSSYPHEILHNWWGNSVFVKYEEGNWCEGLTAYLADHLLKEQVGQGEAYRRDTLLRYRNFVRHEKDFPLTQFLSRHSAATEAVGYGKSLMLFHMLRRRLGDDTFRQALRNFYGKFRFTRAAWSDLADTFSEAADRDLHGFFRQWVERTGAPEIKILHHDYSFDRTRGSRLVLDIAQVQPEAPFDLDLPVAVHVAGADHPVLFTVELRDRRERFTLEGTGPVTRVEVDPCFDLFRRLDRSEIPPTIGQVFGAEKVLILLPSGAEEGMHAAWRKLADTWRRGQEERIAVAEDEAVAQLPADAAVWIFGRANRWCKAIERNLAARDVVAAGDHLTLAGEEIPWKEHCRVMTFRHPENEELALCWVTADRADALPGLGRKLPHYGKYSYLAFQGAEPTNVLKGQWPAKGSPLVRVLDPGAKPLSMPARAPLAETPVRVDAKRLAAHVRFLAGDRLKGRGLGTPELDEAAEYIGRLFKEYGLEPGGEMGTYFQAWRDRVGPDDHEAVIKNVVGILRGRDPALAGETVVVGAHYDHLGLGWPDVHKGDEGKIHNGADDNASGVAVLLELARLMAEGPRPARTITFAAFTGEEAGLRGSRRFVKQALDGGLRIHSMVNLDTVGRLKGRKILVFGADSAGEWPHIVRGVTFTIGVEAECAGNDPGGSDQVSFLHAGIPAIQLFSGMHMDYHRPTDDVEKIDVPGMVKVTLFAKETVAYLADRKEPLASRLEQAGGSAGGAAAPPKGRGGSGRKRAALGTMPDFTYKGEGVRVQAVEKGTPAEKAGIRAGDILVGLGEVRFKDLRGYAGALYRYKAGETVTVHLIRDGKAMKLTATLAER